MSSQEDSREMEIDTDSDAPSVNRSLFLEKVRLSNSACQNGQFEAAVRLYSEAIQLDSDNHILFSNRSAVLTRLGRYKQALQDATRAHDLNPSWPKAYYRQGVALQCMGRYGEALAAFSQGLALDSKSSQLLTGLVETVIKSPLKSALESTFMQLQAMRLDKSAFVIMSVIGQELLAAGSYSAAIVVLDAALKIGTCSLKLRGSVFSALSSAYWAMNSLDKAMSYMQQDLSVAKSLGDIAGECRAHGNLGSAFFSKGNLKEALTSHRYQLVLAMKCKDTLAAAAALTSLGHVYTAIGDYPNALASHKQCVQLVRQLGDSLQEAREIGNVGAVYLAMGDFENAVDCHLEHLRISKQMGNRVEEARAFSNLGSSHHYKRNFEQAITFHNHVLLIAQELQDRAIEARAYAGLGHAARCMADYSQARRWHEKQLDVALNTKDRTAEGRACTNLGIVYQLLGDHDAALKLHQAHLNIARALHDRAGMGRAYGNIGNAYSSMGYYEQAIKYHKQELTISKEVNDRSSEASTHGNLAVAYQALGMHEMALLHYLGHLNIARELKDTPGEACALCNLGNCHSSRGQFSQAAPYYEQYLMLSQELQDVEGEARACHFLGYAHYCLGNYQEAIHYYEQDLTLAKDLQDRMNMGRAYCNLGLAHVALGNFEKALECQKFFFAIANMLKHAQGTFRALGNIGDVLMRMQNHDEAISYYHKQLAASKKSGDRHLQACSYGALGRVHRSLRHFDKSLGFHTQELTIRQEMADLRGECKAHAHLGAVHMSLCNYTNAIKCYEEQLERANELRDLAMRAQAYGNLGIARLNMSHFEDAIGFFEQQLAALEQLQSGGAPLDKARCFGNLADCYDAIGDSEQAVRLHEQYLSLSLKLKADRDQEKAYRGLGSAHMRLGNLQQALVCCEKRLVVAHELNNAQAKASAYGELGLIHGRLANYEQALACLDHQLNIAKELNDAAMEGQAAGGLGSVHQLMGELDAAMRYHQLDLDLSQSAGLLAGQVRALGQLGATCEARSQLQQATDYWERQLSAAEQLHDPLSRTAALASLGRVHHALGDGPRALDYLQKALQLSEQLDGREEEARIRQRLGLVLWEQQQLRPAQVQLEQAASLLESVRRQTTGGLTSTAGLGHHKLQLYDLQTTAYQTLECVLVALGCHSEALVVAERSRTRALADLLLRRSSSGLGGAGRLARVDDNTAATVEQIVEAVDRQKASVLYYSLAAGRLHVWLVVPGRGIVHFHQVNLNEVPTPAGQQPAEDERDAPRSLLQGYIESVRDALGVEMTTSVGQPVSNGDGDGANMWQQHLEDLGDRINQENDKTGFLRMVNRNHVCNQSNYSLSSMFSAFSCSVAGSLASGTPSRAGSTRSRRALWQGPQCLRSLYELLIAPMEQHLPQGGHSRDLMLVLEGDLYLVPFAVLKDPGSSEYLCERFNLILTPAISALRNCSTSRAAKTAAGGGSALVVGNPRLPTALMEQWGWNDIPYSEQEANIVASMLETTPLTGPAASRAAVLQQLCQAECVHLAAHVSWKLSAVVLSPGEWHGGRPCGSGSSHDDDQSEEAASSSAELPPFSEFLLTAADILSLKLSAKLVVVSSCHTRDHHGQASSDGVVALTRALLAAGAQCVLFSLWPVADTAVKILYRAFYSSLLQGARVSRALNDAMLTVQNTKHFAHPANWAGHVLLGCDVRLTNNVALMGQALCQLLAQPDRCRDALRVCLHLMEKSLQRITRRHKNAMYTTQKSIENKVGGLDGWRELLIAVGFRFEPAAHGIPSSVFFPQSDPGQRLGQCSASLQALLALSAESLAALCKLLSARREHADQMIEVMRRVIDQLPASGDLQTESVSTSMAVELWRADGCHELLASLGFDLMEVGRDEVHLKTSKTASKRSIQFTLQALLALFDTQEAPKNLEVEFSSSVESSSDDEVPQSSRAPLPGAGGAFCSYVRGRGQPDGARRTLPPPLVPPPAVSSRGLGNESDAAFTPSPVDAHVAHTPPPSVPAYHQVSPKPSPRLSLSLSHQNRIRSLYQTAAVEPRPGSSGSSTAGGSTAVTALRRQPQPVSSAEAPLDKLSVRTELRRAPASGTRAVRSNPPAASMAPSSGAEDMSASHGSSIQDHIIATQMSRLRELPITDVYHERSIGLGLAPPLSKLLMSDCTAADDVHDDMATLQKLSISERRAAPVPRRSDLAPTPGKRNNSLFTGPKSWSSGGSHHVHDATTTRHDTSTTPPSRSGDELPRRDDGDGRSMTDSNYSSYSPSYQSAAALVHRHDDHKQAFSNAAFETDVPSISVSTRQQSAQIAEYMHQVLGNADDHIGHVTRRAGAAVRGSWTTPKSAARKSLTHSLHPSAEC